MPRALILLLAATLACAAQAKPSPVKPAGSRQAAKAVQPPEKPAKVVAEGEEEEGAMEAAGAPDPLKEMETAMAMVGPMLGRITEVLMEAELNVIAKPEAAQRVAQFKRNLLDALVKAGFTREEAMTMVVNTPVPSFAIFGK